MEEIEKTEEKFPQKCAYFRRWKRALVILIALTALFGVFSGVAIRSGNSIFIGVEIGTLLFFFAMDVLWCVLYGKNRKRRRRYKRVYPLEIIREEVKYFRRFLSIKRYRFEVVYLSAQDRISGFTAVLYSRKEARRTEELFQKRELRVFYDPERKTNPFVFPDI